MSEVLQKNSFCSFCGARFTEQATWPRKCHSCMSETFSNPIPVVVGILPMGSGNKRGMIIQQRGINPQKGNWALTGGYMNHGETWQEALAREVKEELGLETTPDEYYFHSIAHSTNRAQVLIIGQRNKLIESLDDLGFRPNEEVTDIKVIYESIELAFESHTKAVESYFDALKPYQLIAKQLWDPFEINPLDITYGSSK